MLNSKTQIIAEVKTHSPFGWRSEKSWDELFDLANEAGDIISIHTDPRWHGSFELVKKAARQTKKPILAKGIHSSDADIQKALDSGASWVLVVGRVPKIHLEHCFIETLTISELTMLPPGTHAVWNSRDLATGNIKKETFAQAREVWQGWLCQASNIRTPSDVNNSADAILVGTHLPDFMALMNRPATK